MPPRKRTTQKTTETPEFYEWDTFVIEAHVDVPPYKIRVPVEGEVKEGEDTHEFLTIPCLSGSAYINMMAAKQRNDIPGVLVNLTTSGPDDEANSELFSRLMDLMSRADFPIVDKLGESVLRHYFNTPPKAADGGPGESAAS